MQYNPLTDEEKRVIEGKGTEAPFSGEYDNFYKDGVFVCRKCNTPIFSSKAKFNAGCGWPSFDDNFPNAVKRIPDSDGLRTEIQCATCGGHLGHIFEGEHFTEKDTRYCVNSLSIKFMSTELTTFAGGCFWCTEAIFKRLKGVISAVPGYAGGHAENPTYEQVSSGSTGHAEATQIEFDPNEISYAKLLDIFWHTHDPTTMNRQGSDVGTQYRSAIFYHNEEQKKLAEHTKAEISKAITEIVPFTKFYVAEGYHKNYFDRNGSAPYCNIVISPKINKLLENYATDVKEEYKAI